MASFARLSTILVLLVALAGSASAMEDAIAPATVEDGVVSWSPTVPYVLATLEIRGPNGVTLRRSFEPGQPLAFDPSAVSDATLSDGFYLYDLTFVTGEEVENEDGEPALATQTQTGGFEVGHGHALDSAALPFFHTGAGSIDGSLCVGFDCIANESFGFDTIRMKENNLRVNFEDTSVASSFPTNDWRIIINDSSNGGANYFGIEDSSGGRIPFRVEAGARANALVVESDGDIGIGTINPVADIHVLTGNTPTMRLDQDGSSGFTPQVWDVASNETNFFIRDATFGSKLPFRIRPNSLTSSIDVGPGGVGFNNSSPGNVVHIKARDAASASERALNVDGHTRLGGDVFTAGRYAAFYPNTLTQPALQLADVTNIANPILKVEVNGDHTITGTSFAVTHTNTSDVHVKENITPADVDAILEGVVSLPISTWEYIADEADALHLGPMAQDFRAAFGLGVNDTTISTIDSEGVALAAIQALAARSEANAARAEAATARVADLEVANAALEARLARLEALLGADHE